MQWRAWLGASVAMKTASIWSSRTSSSRDGYVFEQRHALAKLFASLGNEIADGYDLDIGMILKPESGTELAYPVTDDADADFTIRDRLPALGGPPGLRRFFKPLNIRGCLGAGWQTKHDGSKRGRLKERSAGSGSLGHFAISDFGRGLLSDEVDGILAFEVELIPDDNG